MCRTSPGGHGRRESRGIVPCISIEGDSGIAKINAKMTRAGRIAPLDGLRAVAALGVVWVHVWTFTGNPAWPHLSFGPFDPNRVLAVLGEGVHLFFVISGFCMYLMYGHRSDRQISYSSFVVRRWWRIAPAFYVCILASVPMAVLLGRDVTAVAVAKHFVFAHLWPPTDNRISPPFWSLATEWHFYLVLPLLVWAWRRWPFGVAFGVSCAVAVSIRVFAYMTGFGLELGDGQIWLRLIEFLWGAGAAHLYLRGGRLPALLGGTGGVFSACGMVYLGRVMRLTEVTSRFGATGSALLWALSDPVMTLGFAWLVFLAVSERNGFSRLLEVRPLKAIGLWSYSLYLWHWYPCLLLAKAGVWAAGSNVLVQNVVLIGSLAILIPLSALSYRMLEAPYLRRGRAPSGASTPETLAGSTSVVDSAEAS